MVAVLHEDAAGSPLEHVSPLANASAEVAERLIDLQLSFNLFPALYAHDSWVRHCAGPAAEGSSELALSPFWIRTMSAALLRHEGLEAHCDCDFFDPAKRLALLEAATLIHIGALVTATLLRERLRRTISKADVQAAQACMGAEAHCYAVRWQGAAPFVGPIFDSRDWPSPEAWQRKGVALLFASIPEPMVGVRGRMRLRFPCDWALPDPSLPRLNEPQRISLTRFIVEILTDAVPQCRWLFEPPGAHARWPRSEEA